MRRRYCVSEGDFVTGRLISGNSMLGRCFMRDPPERWDTICDLISWPLVTFLPTNLQPVVHRLSYRACREFMTRVDDFYQAYKQFKEWRERYLQSLFGDFIDLDRIKLDTLIGMKRLPPFLRGRYRCPIKTGVDRFYYWVTDELEKNWDLAAAIATNGFLLFEMLHKIDQELQDKNKIARLISSPFRKFAELVRYYIGDDRYKIRIEDICCEYDSGEGDDNDLSEPSGRAIILGGFVPSEHAADIHYNLDFQFGLPTKEKEKLVDIARKRNIEVDISKIKIGTETVDREELEVIREILSSDKAYEGERALIHPQWEIIDRNSGEPLVKVRRENGDVIEGGFIFAFTGRGGVRRERGGRIEGIALMGAGASGTVVAPHIVLMGSHWKQWLKDDIRRKLEEYNENGYQAVFKINYDPSVEGRPYGPEHIRSIEVKGIKPLS